MVVNNAHELDQSNAEERFKAALRGARLVGHKPKMTQKKEKGKPVKTPPYSSEVYASSKGSERP